MYQTTANIDSEFNTFRKLAQSIIIRYDKKVHDVYDNDSDYADVLALYMLNKLSRYGLTKFFEAHWLWNKSVDSLSLAEILTEADRYKPEYDKQLKNG